MRAPRLERRRSAARSACGAAGATSRSTETPCWSRGKGTGRAALRPLPGDNLVEARLLEGTGGGFWQFDLVAGAPREARALRVVTGELAAIGPDFVTFRLTGRPGERVSFVWTWGRAEK